MTSRYGSNARTGFVPGGGGAMATRNGMRSSSPCNPKAKRLMNRVTGGALTAAKAQELLPECLEGSKRYSVPDPLHGVKVKGQIMQRVKGARHRLAGHVKVPEVGAAVMRASVAVAARIDRSGIVDILGVADIDPALAGEQLTVPRIPRRHHTVEHVDASGHALDQVLRRSGPHQIPRLIRWQTAGCQLDRGIHLLDRLTHAQPAERIAFEPH